MATTRERKEARIARRMNWASKAKAAADSRFSAVGAIADTIPMGQPILVGHHSERRARRDADRIDRGMAAGVALTAKAGHHEAFPCRFILI